MSDSQELEDSRTDTQDTYYEKTDAAETLNESQDFHLFDVDDVEFSSDKSEKNSEKHEEHDQNSKSNETSLTKAEAVVTNPLETEKQGEIASKKSKKDKQMAESVQVVEDEIIEDTSDLDMEEKVLDEEDDIVQGTPPQIHSPSKRQLASVGETTPHKRKAEFFDEPACKILRTISQENALTFDRERSDEAKGKHLIKVQEKAVFEEDNIVEDTEALDRAEDSNSLHSNVQDVIEETQEMECDSEPADERVSGRSIGILEKAEKDLDHRMQECSERIGLSFGLDDCQASEKSDRTDQNLYVREYEDSNDLTKLNQSTACEAKSKQGSVDDTEVRASNETMEKERSQDKSTPCDDEETKLNLDKVHVKQSSKILKKLENLEQKSGSSESELESNVKDSDENMDVQSLSSNNDHSIKSKSSVSVVEGRKLSSNKDNSDSYNKENDLDLKADKMSQKKESDYSSETVPQMNTSNSRMSIELVYEGKSASQENKSKLMEIVEIDEDGEHIIIDSSQEEHDLKDLGKSYLNNSDDEATQKSKSTSDRDYKSVGDVKEPTSDFNLECQLTNGSDDSKKDDTERTLSVGSDIFLDESVLKYKNQCKNLNVQTLTCSTSKKPKITKTVSKSSDCLEVLLTDSEGDCSMLNENTKNKSLLETSLAHNSLNRKELQVKREIGFYVRLECLLHIDENTKEFVSKELTNVQCDSIAEITSSIHQRNNDTSGSLADISGNDNKDSPLGSVNSNPQPYALLPSRLSFISTVSSSSSASSAISLAAKFALKDDLHFSLPRGPAKHAKKQMTSDDKLSMDDFNRLTKEWKNTDLLVTTVLNSVNSELQSGYFHNGGIEGIEDPLQKIQSSTPEVMQSEKITTAAVTMTPKSRKKGTNTRRARSKSTRTSRSNGSTKVATSANILSTEDSSNAASSLKKSDKSTDTYSISEGTTASVDSSGSLKQNLKTIEALKNLTPQNMPNDELLGKEVFAKWSDKNYYPGTVIDRSKSKFMVNFYDGQSKLLQQEFIIPIPKTLSEGLSVYATTVEDDYGSSGMITNVETIKGTVYYTVETDEGEKIQVQIKDIFLTCDQAQILREIVNVEKKNLPLTPQHMGQITLDNMIDGKRRSRRIATPNASTPKFRKISSSSTNKNADTVEPSVSGINSRLGGTERLYSENESRTSDSGSSVIENIDLYGVQPDLVENSNEQVTKGLSSRVKGKARNRKKSEDEETIATLGPIPPFNSNIFKGMSFILTCAPLETSDKYQMICEDSNTDSGTENEGDWMKLPFVANRLTKQLTAGGGKVYENFEDIPQDEYKSTKLITNVPNITAKSLQCLAVGIYTYNHQWIIRCCKQNEMVNPDEHVLPAGWSLDNRSYVEMYQRLNDKPLTGCVVVIPMLQSNKQFVSFWYQICENAGGIVLRIDNPEISFDHGTVVLANHQCPAWVVKKANSWQIPLVSTTWITQCLIEGKICPYDTQPCYKYNYSKV